MTPFPSIEKIDEVILQMQALLFQANKAYYDQLLKPAEVILLPGFSDKKILSHAEKILPQKMVIDHKSQVIQFVRSLFSECGKEC